MDELDPAVYTVAWIAPLEIEAQAALHMLDHRHHGYFPTSRGDDYVFLAGDILGHNVIIATLPAGREYGTGSAAALASQVKEYFPNLWFGLLVGVATGLPNLSRSPPRDIRLGDVLVALPEGESAGLVAYDLGKETTDDGLQPLQGGRVLATTETVIRSAIGSIKLYAPDDAALFLEYYEAIKDQEHATGTFSDPGQEHDKLYATGDDGQEQLVDRLLRPKSRRTRVWYGPIGSGEKLLKNACKRDELRDRYDLIGLEIEAAGTINRIPVGAIRGACDYGDAHENKQWLPYAAAMAAAYAKTVLEAIQAMTQAASAPAKSEEEEEADKLEVAVMETRKTGLGADHPDTLNSMANLASTFWNQGRWDEAEKLEVEVMETSKTKLGIDHPDTLTSMNNLASTYRNQGQWDKAEALEVEVMKTNKTKLGADHPDTLNSMANLAWTYWNQGRWDEAEKLEVEVMETSKTKLGADHPDTLNSIASLASTFWNQGQWDEAEKLFMEVIKTSKTKFGADHPDTLNNMANLASTYQKQGRWDQAEELCAEVMETSKQKLGFDHPNTLNCMQNLAFTWHAQKRTMEAIDLLDSCFQLRFKVLGPDHPSTSSSLQLLNTWRAEQGMSPLLAATLPSHHLGTMLPAELTTISEDTAYSTTYTRHGLSTDIGELSTLPSHECSAAPNKRAAEYAIPRDDGPGGLEYTNELDDTRSEYSEAGSLAAIEDSYSAALAEKIRVDLGLTSQQISPDDFEQFTAQFPELLKAFSADISHRSNNNIGRDAGFHVHKNRESISRTLKSLLQLDLLDNHYDSNLESGAAEPTDLELSIDWAERQQRVSEWTSVISDPHLATLPDPYFDHHLSQDGWISDAEAPSFDRYRTALDESGAYKWLLASMQTHFCLSTSPANTIQTIGKTIKGQLPRERISRRKSAPRHKLSIAVDWQPLAFLSGQGYHLPPQEVVSRVLVVTGTPRHAQASTCIEYIQRTWPVTGSQTLQCVQKVLCHGVDDFDGAEKVVTDDGELSLELSNGYLLAIITGSEAFLSEVGEQLAWMGAAMRSVGEETGLTAVSPAIKLVNQQSPTRQPASRRGTAHCDIHFTMTFSEQKVCDADATDISRTYGNGQCWHALFRNPVIVDGFPISRRELSDTGLEVSLELMAALTDATRINVFQGIPMIKGFSRLLFPLQQSTDTVIWHLVCNQNGSHISFMEGITCHSIGLELGVIEKSRHIIGWCKEAELYVGALDANHPVCSSALAKDPWKTGFEDRVLEVGRLISQGIIKGSRDIPRHLSRNKDYYTQMMWLQTRKIILWDEGDKRGWLADGLSVLLHLLRAHILHHSTGQFRRIFKLKPDSLQFGGNIARSPEASLQILLDPDNLNLAVFPDGDVRLKDRVLDFYNFLEQAVDHQDAIDRQCRRARRSSRSRGKLEGWDFKEFVTLSDFVEPRTADLGTAGRSWVDLTRSMRTAVLFGQNFGDMILPSQFSEHCTWAQVPTGQFLLTALVQDLGVERIHSTSGRITTTIQGGDLEWHSPGGITFQQCPCSDQSSSAHHNFIQVLLPRNTSSEFPIQEPSISQTHPLHPGAVIFGYNSHFGWQWDDRGVLTRSELSTPVPTEGDEHTLSSPQSSDDDSDSAHGTPADAASFEPEIGIICALSKELRAILTLFECRETKPLIEGDLNHYSYGHLAGYRVVAAALPHGIYGISTAGSVATHLRRSFPRLHFCLLVGIGAGVPRLHKNIDIRLGDVVVGVSPDGSADLVWNGKGKRNDGTLETSRHTLQGPPSDLRRLITSLQSDPENGGCCRLKPYLDRIKNKRPEYAHPGVEHDKLYATTKQKQPEGTENSSLQHEQLIPREGRPTTRPYVHYGPIATGDVLVKDAELRDRLGEDLNVHCIEMEAGGITNEIPCLVIRGICDYADNRKNDDWQEYAAATAAAYAAYLLTQRRGFSATQARTRRKGKRLAGEELQGRRKARRV